MKRFLIYPARILFVIFRIVYFIIVIPLAGVVCILSPIGGTIVYILTGTYDVDVFLDPITTAVCNFSDSLRPDEWEFFK